MHRTSTPIVRMPETSGKACGQLVQTVLDACGQKPGLIHKPVVGNTKLGISDLVVRTLYTNCMQVYKQLVGNFTSVNPKFYTVYTAPITTTTTYI